MVFYQFSLVNFWKAHDVYFVMSQSLWEFELKPASYSLGNKSCRSDFPKRWIVFQLRF